MGLWKKVVGKTTLIFHMEKCSSLSLTIFSQKWKPVKVFLSRLFKLHYGWLKNEILRVTKTMHTFVKNKDVWKPRVPQSSWLFYNNGSVFGVKWTQFFDFLWHCKTVHQIRHKMKNIHNANKIAVFKLHNEFK